MTEAAPNSPRLPWPWPIAVVFGAAVVVWLFVFYWVPLSREYDRTTHLTRALLSTALIVSVVVFAWRALDRRP
ncbi:hypothetical protein [Yinghuangia sp. YIM S09857]|uniref:hypothetical protein n=1 Tax=Yinghuangia sp. YIM S09857 TaxID=3436929 RepID=UPI003F529AB6